MKIEITQNEAELYMNYVRAQLDTLLKMPPEVMKLAPSISKIVTLQLKILDQIFDQDPETTLEGVASLQRCISIMKEKGVWLEVG